MNLNTDIKTDIQCFVYFLFKGTLFNTPKKIDDRYLDRLLSDSQLLYNCFEVFSYSMQKSDVLPPNGAVTEYIAKIMTNGETSITEIENYNRNQNNFWNDFLDLAHKFCFDELSENGIKIDIQSLKGCGTDAVPIFAVWSNIIELDANNQLMNKSYVFKRLWQRFSSEKQNEYFPKFEEWEIEQEIY